MIILTEKPSVAAAFASALSVPRKYDYFENTDYCIVSALGHLLETAPPDDYKKEWGKPWTLNALPILPDKIKLTVKIPTKNKLDTIKKCFDSRKNDSLLLATDAEREGELIGAEILDYVGFKNYNNAKRFWVSEALTTDVIINGIKNAKPLSNYTPYKEQGAARQEADWLVGMNLTRLLSLGTGATCRIGRVKTAILAAVYARCAAIASFIKEKYAELSTNINNFPLKLINPDNIDYPHRFPPNHPLLLNAKNDITNNSTAKIISVQKDNKIIPPPQLFNLTALQKESHKKLNLSPEETLSIAQALYENHKCLSYPRTPSRVMGDDNVQLVKSIFNKLKTAFPDMALGVNENSISLDNKRLFNSTALQDHHALIPLDIIPHSASQNEKNVYNLILASFFTTLKPPFIYNAVTINANINNYNFKGCGTEIIDAGWKLNSPFDDDAAADNEQTITETIENNAEYPVSTPKLEEKYTEPKKYYTFASILSLMENPRGDDGAHLIGLGTPATRGKILDDLFTHKYLEQKSKSIIITDTGKFIIESISKNDSIKPIISISETTRWEEELHKNTASFLNNIKNFIKNAVSNSHFDRAALKKEPLGKCPLCKHGDIYEGKSNYYCSEYKSQDCRFIIWKETLGAVISQDDAKLLLQGKQTKSKKFTSKDGKKYEAALYLNGTKLEKKFLDKKLDKKL